MELTRFLDGLDFGEAPRWREGRLWYSDFYQQAVYSVTPDGVREPVVRLGDKPSGLGWLPNGDLLIVGMDRRQVLRFDGSKTVVHAELAELAPGPCNDMVVTHRGHAYVGNFGFDFFGGDSPRATQLIHIAPDGHAQRVGTDLHFPNGTVITPDGATLIVGESFASQYTAFDLDEDGTLSNGRVWASVPGMSPDGCALDAENAIWFSDAGSGQAVCRIAAGGQVLERIETPEPTFACMLGGQDRRTLFVFTAPGANPESVDGKRGGSIWATRVEVPGAGLP